MQFCIKIEKSPLVSIKVVLRIVRSSRLRQRIDMILGKLYIISIHWRKRDNFTIRRTTLMLTKVH